MKPPFFSPCNSLVSSLLGSKATMVLSLSLTCFLVLWSTTSPYLATFSILLISTIFFYFTLSKRRAPAREIGPSQCGRSTSKSLHGEEELVEAAASPRMEKVAGHCGSTCEGEVSHLEACEVEATGFPSDSETTEESSGNEIFELGWSRNLVVSDQSESSDFDGDEDDDLIEINLPEGDPDGCTNGSMLKSAEFVSGEVTSPMEILEDDLEEINEDDSLMEIDLSMGSIKSNVQVVHEEGSKVSSPWRQMLLAGGRL